MSTSGLASAADLAAGVTGLPLHNGVLRRVVLPGRRREFSACGVRRHFPPLAYDETLRGAINLSSDDYSSDWRERVLVRPYRVHDAWTLNVERWTLRCWRNVQ